MMLFTDGIWRVPCAYSKCPEYRAHHERPDEPRGIQWVPVPEDHQGPAYCSLTCKMLAKAEADIARRTWSFEQAQGLIEKLRLPLLEAGWCIGLTGSVLWNSKSAKDLDLIVYPFDTSKARDLERLRAVFEEAGMHQVRTVEWLRNHWRTKKKSLDEKHVEVWAYERRRVDVFVLS